MKTFRERLEERVRDVYRKNNRLIGCDEERAALAGAAAALEIAAEEGEEQQADLDVKFGRFSNDDPASVNCDWLRARAREIRGGE